ncbi:MAG TPA: cysteine synthase family protein [Nitrospirota bacterium]|nr:cysteine synthase family protein [Nitrospirota bacterium]
MSVLDSIGNTPLVEIKNVNPDGKARIFAKLEGANPGGSVKDRPAYYMVMKAEEQGLLTRDKVILEATSGNTGIGLAMVAAAKGYRLKLTMPACVSLERRSILEALGAEIVLTPAEQGTDGAIMAAHKILDESPDVYFMPNQFENDYNVIAHYETTGREVYEQTKGEVTAFVAGIGTTGTIMGVGRRLKEYDSSIRIIGIEPVKGHKIQGLKNMKEAIVPGIFDPSKLDDKITIDDALAYDTARDLALKEGIFVGMSSGAAMAGAIEAARRLGSGVIVTVFPDRGDRYLSTTLFKSICGKCNP